MRKSRYVMCVVVWYGMVVQSGGCIIWLNNPWRYGMFQSIRAVRVEYAVRISSITTLHISHWNVFEIVRHADRRTDT